MTRSADRAPGAKFGGSRTAAALEWDDASLTPGLVVDGRPSRVSAGDHLVLLTALQCMSCHEQVGRIIWHIGPPMEHRYRAEVQMVTDVEAQSMPKFETIRFHVPMTGTFPADCPEHGRLSFPSEPCREHCDQKIGVALRRGHCGVVNVARFYGEPQGWPLGHDLQKPHGMAVTEMAAWLGWDTPKSE